MCSLSALTEIYLDISVNYLVIVQVLQSFENLLGVENNGGLVVFKRPPLWPQERGQTSCDNKNKKWLVVFVAKTELQLFVLMLYYYRQTFPVLQRAMCQRHFLADRNPPPHTQKQKHTRQVPADHKSLVSPHAVLGDEVISVNGVEQLYRQAPPPWKSWWSHPRWRSPGTAQCCDASVSCARRSLHGEAESNWQTQINANMHGEKRNTVLMVFVTWNWEGLT